jgi:hypothetical protein
MRIDLSKCFQSPFEDSGWIVKVLIGSVLQLLSVFLIPLFAFTGYFLKATQQAAEGNDEKLPEWDDWGTLIMRGLVFNLGVALWVLLPTGLMIFGGWSIFASLIVGVSGNSGASAAAGAVGGTLALACFAVGALLLFLVSIFLPAITIRYAVTNQFAEFLNVGGIFSLIMSGPLEYLVILIVPTVFMMAFGLVTTITGGLASILAIPAGVVLALIMAKLQGSFYRNCLA